MNTIRKNKLSYIFVHDVFLKTGPYFEHIESNSQYLLDYERNISKNLRKNDEFALPLL